LHDVGVDIAGSSGFFLGVAEADPVFPNCPAAPVLPPTIVPVPPAAGSSGIFPGVAQADPVFPNCPASPVLPPAIVPAACCWWWWKFSR